MSKEYIEKLKEKIDENWDEQMKTLKELISIEGIAEETGDEEKPFGEGVHRAFSYVLDKAETMGFETKNVDNYGGHVDFAPVSPADTKEEEAREEVMGIVGHLDTVPIGERKAWKHDPLGCEIDDGVIYGRGVQDDRGPVVASMYAMKALKDLGFVPSKRVRLILGLDEETNWNGMEYYLKKVPEPDFGFSPDADFPVIRIEKGVLMFDLAKKFAKDSGKGLQLRSLTGGTAVNMVPQKARAVVFAQNKEEYEYIKEQAMQWSLEKRANITTKQVGKSLEILVKGKTAHGSTPELGVNAIGKMMRFLGILNFESDDVTDFIEFYNKMIGEETNGMSLGCGFSDEESGDTVLNAGIIDLNTEAVRVEVNIRYPISYKAEDYYEAMAKKCEPYNVGIVKGDDHAPIYRAEDDADIMTYMDIYKEHTGDINAEPLVIGGATYARAFSNFVGFGAVFPGGDDCAHQADEHMPLEDFRRITLIYADAIYRLAGCGLQEQ